jgi:hypothetical protein
MSVSGPAWVDSDDENLQIDLESNPRLKKLGAEKVSGVEYTDRLRAFHAK